MRITSTLLCDAATVREGLLHVLGGGISRIWRPELPGPLGVALAIVVAMEREAEDVVHRIDVKISDHDLATVGSATATLAYNGGARMEPGEEHTIPLVLPLHEVTVNRYGRHDIGVAIDGSFAAGVVLWVLHPDERELPPL